MQDLYASDRDDKTGYGADYRSADGLQFPDNLIATCLDQSARQ
jgi:hypothetical protein